MISLLDPKVINRTSVPLLIKKIIYILIIMKKQNYKKLITIIIKIKGWLGWLEQLPWPLGVDRPPQGPNHFIYLFIWALGVAGLPPRVMGWLRPTLTSIGVALIFY
jgi:hypothetical protein